MAKIIDLNSDLGESFGAWKMGMDDKIVPLVTSANVACGFHAGDWTVMHKTVKLALESNTAVGAHPGLPDLQGFGRRKLEVTPEETYDIMVYQIGALASFAAAAGTKLQHVKPHGAIYNMAAKDAKLAEAIAQAVYDVDKELILYALAGSESVKAAQKIGLPVASEVFADRSYQEDGSLTPRKLPGAMITDEAASIKQVLGMILDKQVTCLSGKVIPVQADTLCVHGDGAKALLFVEKIRTALQENGIEIAPTGKFIK